MIPVTALQLSSIIMSPVVMLALNTLEQNRDVHFQPEVYRELDVRLVTLSA